MAIDKKDYEEACCPLKTERNVTPIDVGRMIEKLDEYLGKNDYAGAGRHLAYWIAEAEAMNDERGKLTVLNEQIGLFRKTEQPEKGLPVIGEALRLCEKTGLSDTVTGATTYVNAATAYKAFGQADKALPLYEKARAIYERELDEDDSRLGGLYNNMALTVAETSEYEEAETLFHKALSVMERVENGEAEQAVTYCNLADLAANRFGTVEAEAYIGDCLDRAERLLDTPALPRNGYYAFICEKCAPAFGYYGRFFTEKELMKRAKGIYERA